MSETLTSQLLLTPNGLVNTLMRLPIANDTIETPCDPETVAATISARIEQNPFAGVAGHTKVIAGRIGPREFTVVVARAPIRVRCLKAYGRITEASSGSTVSVSYSPHPAIVLVLVVTIVLALLPLNMIQFSLFDLGPVLARSGIVSVLLVFVAYGGFRELRLIRAETLWRLPTLQDFR